MKKINQIENIKKLFGVRYPIIQGGMVWVSGYKLASAVSNAGALGLIGAGSMKPELLKEHIVKANKITKNPFGVNIPLLRGDAEELIKVCLLEKVKIIFTSAGSPAKYISLLKSAGCVVAHVVSNVKQAKKSEECGIDAVVAEGYEAGGHNGYDELTTFCLIPQVVDAVNIPVIAAGGIADGRGMLAAFSLGASGVQIGTLFAASKESSAHENYKNAVINSKDNSSVAFLRKLSLIRALRNKITDELTNAELRGDSVDELKSILGAKREFKGIFEGDLDEGLLEAGQSAGMVKSIQSASEIIKNLIASYNEALKNIHQI